MEIRPHHDVVSLVRGMSLDTQSAIEIVVAT